MPTVYLVLGIGLALVAGRIVITRVGPPTTWAGRATRIFSPPSLVIMTLALAALAFLHDTRMMERQALARMSFFVVIPIAVVLVSLFAGSFVEPLAVPWLLFFIPLLCDFFPVLSGPDNPVRSLSGTDPRSGLNNAALLGLLAAIVIVPLSLVGCAIHYVSRKVRARQWTWSALRGLAWGCACAGGGYFGLRSKVLSDITFHNDYRLLWAILGISVVVAALGGLKRNPRRAAATEGLSEVEGTAADRGGMATQTPSDGPGAPTRRMVGGAKFGLTMVCLYVVFIGSLIFGHSWWQTFHHAVGTETSELVGYSLLFGFPILIGLAGLTTGIQKSRPGIGVLALLTTPIGFFFALAAKNRRPQR